MDEHDEYMVLVNAEEQHSLWPTHKPVPPGWLRVGPVGDRDACMAYVETAWLDITPASARHGSQTSNTAGDGRG